MYVHPLLYIYTDTCMRIYIHACMHIYVCLDYYIFTCLPLDHSVCLPGRVYTRVHTRMCVADGEGCGCQVASLEVAHVEAAMREGGVCYPVIIKPQIACGTEEAHNMVTGLTPPCWDGEGLMCHLDDFYFDVVVGG